MKAIENRRSIRKYKDQPIDEKLLLEIIRNASLAPSGNNTQPWNFIIVDNLESRKEISIVCHNQKWMNTAPVFIVCVADINCRVKETEKINLDEETSLFELKQIIRDTAISIEHLVIEATEQGLGTCWVAWYEQKEIRPLLGIPNDKYVVGIITIGYSDENPKQRPRKNIEDIIHRNKW